MVLAELHLVIVHTDQSFIFSGNISLRHLIRSTPSSLSSNAVSHLEHAGITQLHHLASWTLNSDYPTLPPSWSLTIHPNLFPLLRFTPAASDWPDIQHWIASLTLHDLTTAPLTSAATPLPTLVGTGSSGIVLYNARDTRIGSSGIRPHNARVPGSSGDTCVARDWMLTLPRDFRRALAEHVLHTLTLVSSQPPSHFALPMFASDGSLILAAPSFRQFRSAVFAAARPTSTTVCSLASFHNGASILHAEVYGLVAASLQASTPSSLPPSPSAPLYTDHLNSTRIINDSLSTSFQSLPNRWSSLPARSLYQWLRQILTSSSSSPLPVQMRSSTSLQVTLTFSHFHLLQSLPLLWMTIHYSRTPMATLNPIFLPTSPAPL
ncbi:hypothetical protein SCP_0406170 [Sparassis crispa]|uniref:Uncharacterized protein n=1 Tax=Sparassis crispa TaxID=139825 RepID=A0A401GJ48_9APHY|nr:hypothetical protein SCP_0406170 [Sparassis crispa]GBE82234.1 hypothetical protein SCP_0406170 [Sparassis crispa]